MSLDNGFASYYQSLDQEKCAQEDAFQDWFEKNERDLREEFLAQVEGLFDDDYANYVSDNYEKFEAWAKDRYEKEAK